LVRTVHLYFSFDQNGDCAPPAVNFQNSAFVPHGVFWCFIPST